MTEHKRTDLSTYSRPRLARSALDVATSVGPYLVLVAVMYVAVTGGAPLLALALAPLAAGFLIRTFIVFHDCAHGSLFTDPRANRWVGRLCSMFVLQPFANWRHDHAVHHGTAGDLDRRGTGDVQTLTTAEYRDRAWHGRVSYRLFRNPLVMFGIGPLWAMMLVPRFSSRSKRLRLRRSIALTNLALTALVAAQVALFGWQAVALVVVPAFTLAATTGVWLFYVQHQFEDVYWETGAEWDYEDAALRGSSYLKLPALLQFFTGNIGLHHVHHLSSKVPNYNLQRAHDENPVFHNVPVLTLRESLRCVRLKLIDTPSGRLVTWAEARAIERARLPGVDSNDRAGFTDPVSAYRA